MKFDLEDPRLTAYVLDELDLAERREVEEMLASNAEAQEFVDSLRQATDALGADLGRALADADAVDLGELRRRRIEKAAVGAGGSRRWLYLGTAGAAAAAALMLVTLKQSDEPTQHANATLASATGSAPASKAAGQPSPDPGPLPGSATFEATDNEASDVSATPTTGTESGYYQRTGIGDSPHAMTDPSRASGQYALSSSNRTPVANAKNSGVLGVMAGEMDPNTVRQLESLGYMGNDYRGHRMPVEVPVQDNPFMAVATEPLSTFSIDVDTASYSQLRRYLRGNSMPPASTVRIEELINYFSYDYPVPVGSEPFGVVTEVSQAPWNTDHKLMRVGIKAREVIDDRRPRANLVFLFDVSGSMSDEDRLPLLKKSFSLLLDRLDPEDRIAIVVYAGASGVVLPSTAVSKRGRILKALKQLKSGGSTNGGAGIELAYTIAQRNFMEGGVNRVILATDGDFNVGTTSRPELVKLIESKAKSDIFLTVLGVGMTNFNDGTMEQLADKGNGNYAYIDTLAEARKVLVDQVHSTLVTVAKDVKLQIEFNPKRVAQYRLIGYENRVLANADFNDDSKDAGDIGAGHTVTALYEIVPPNAGKVDDLRYQTTVRPTAAADSDELLTLKIRYKTPTGDVSKLSSHPVFDQDSPFSTSSGDFKFASAVAGFGMILRNSEHKGNATLGAVLDWAGEGRGRDPHGYRREFISLVKRASGLNGGY